MPNCCGHLAGVDRVVGHRLEPLVLGAEGDRVRVDARVVPLRERGDDAGVEAAAEEGGDRHVGDEVRGDRVLDDRARGRRAARPRPRSRPRRRASTSVPAAAVRPELGPRSRRQLVDALDRAALLGQPVVEHRRDQRAGSICELRSERGDERLQLGREDHARRRGGRKYSGLMPSGSRARYRLPLSLVEDREREHAAEPLEASGPHRRQASSTTSVSRRWSGTRRPALASSARSSR